MKIFKIIVDEFGSVDAIALTDSPAIEELFIAFKEEKRIYFNEDLRIIVSPLLIPNQLIYRFDSNGEYYITIDEENIEKLPSKIIGKNILFNFEHTSKVFEGIEFQSIFLSNSKIGLSAPEFFSHLPEKTLYIVLKINNEEVWKMIKKGYLKGVSIEAIFTVVEVDPKINQKELEKESEFALKKSEKKADLDDIEKIIKEIL